MVYLRGGADAQKDFGFSPLAFEEGMGLELYILSKTAVKRLSF
jgi:hypothetical protein